MSYRMRLVCRVWLWLHYCVFYFWFKAFEFDRTLKTTSPKDIWETLKYN